MDKIVKKIIIILILALLVELITITYVKSDTNVNISIDYLEMFEILGKEVIFYKITI